MRIKTEAFDRELATRGLTQQELAKLANVDESTVSRVRNGHETRPMTIYKLMEAIRSKPELEGVADLLA